MVFVTETNRGCAQLYGDQTDTARRMHRRNKVWFATPQIIVNMLQSGELNLEDVSLIVFDEAHHCTKNSPYNVIMRDFYFRIPPGLRPLVFGMTASPGARKGFIETLKTIGQLCLNMESRIVMPKDVRRKSTCFFGNSSHASSLCLRTTRN
jgi:ERCC4-related helicase